MNAKEILNLIKKLDNEKPIRTPHYYKKNGKMVRRSYDDTTYTNTYYELKNTISNSKCFKCANCGKECTYFDLEYWCCDFDDLDEGIICSECYENEMGEDL